MKFCDERIQKHLLSGGKVKRPFFTSPIYYNDYSVVFKYNNKEKIYCLDKADLAAYDWKIVEPEYDWDKIIKNKVLCIFGKGMNQYYIIGYLQEINSEGKFELLGGLSYDCCRPFNPADFNIAKDLKEYEK